MVILIYQARYSEIDYQTNWSENVTKNDNPTDDPVHIDENFKIKVSFWTAGVFIPVVGGAGIIGNTISAVVLRKQKGNKDFNALLS